MDKIENILIASSVGILIIGTFVIYSAITHNVIIGI